MRVHHIGTPTHIGHVAPGTLVAFRPEAPEGGPATTFGLKLQLPGLDEPRCGVFAFRRPDPGRRSYLLEASYVFAYPDATIVPDKDIARLNVKDEIFPALSLALQRQDVYIVGRNDDDDEICINASDGIFNNYLVDNVAIVSSWTIVLPKPFGGAETLATFSSVS